MNLKFRFLKNLNVLLEWNIYLEIVYFDLLGKFFIVMMILFVFWFREYFVLDFIVGFLLFYRIVIGFSGLVLVFWKFFRFSFMEKVLLNFLMLCWMNNFWDIFWSLNFFGNKLWCFIIVCLLILLSCNKY